MFKYILILFFMISCKLILSILNEFVNEISCRCKKKEDIFTTFFSYLPDDVELLLEEDPENAEYIAFSDWLRVNYESLHRVITDNKTEIKMGLKIAACKRKP